MPDCGYVIRLRSNKREKEKRSWLMVDGSRFIVNIVIQGLPQFTETPTLYHNTHKHSRGPNRAHAPGKQSPTWMTSVPLPGGSMSDSESATRKIWVTGTKWSIATSERSCECVPSWRSRSSCEFGLVCMWLWLCRGEASPNLCSVSNGRCSWNAA